MIYLISISIVHIAPSVIYVWCISFPSSILVIEWKARNHRARGKQHTHRIEPLQAFRDLEILELHHYYLYDTYQHANNYILADQISTYHVAEIAVRST